MYQRRTMSNAPTVNDLIEQGKPDRFTFKDKPEAIDVLREMHRHNCNTVDASSDLGTQCDSKRFTRPLREAIDKGWIRRKQRGEKMYTLTEKGRKKLEGGS